MADGLGPGLEKQPGIDKSLPIAILFVAIGWTPVDWWQAALGRAYFGPLAYPAILTMVGVLASLIGVLRSIDLEDVPLRRGVIVVGALGMVRLFVLPWF